MQLPSPGTPKHLLDMPVYFCAGRWHRRPEVEKDDAMEVEDVSAALQARLGPDATTGLLALLETARLEWKDEVTAVALERFERRLTEEASGLRSEIRELGGALRGEMREGEARLREEMRDLAAALREEGRVNTAALREEVRSGASGLRIELKQDISSLRVEVKDEMSKFRVDVADALSKARVDMMRWSFSLWVGQASPPPPLWAACSGCLGGSDRVQPGTARCAGCDLVRLGATTPGAAGCH
jgi:hypothetical protein